MAAIYDLLLPEQWINGRRELQHQLRELSAGQTRAYYLLRHSEGLARLSPRNPSEALLAALSAKVSTLSKAATELLKRVASLSTDRGLSFFQTLEEARNSELAASAVQKNPTKQGLPEPYAAEYIRQKAGVVVLRLADSSSKLSLRFASDGSVGVNVAAGETYSKDADLAILLEHEGEVEVILASHKFARVGGGHQDNQRSDATRYLVNALRATKKTPDIPSLRALISEALGWEVAENAFRWSPALILDGLYFHGARNVVLGSADLPANAKDSFIGDTDAFIRHFGVNC